MLSSMRVLLTMRRVSHNSLVLYLLISFPATWHPRLQWTYSYICFKPKSLWKSWLVKCWVTVCLLNTLSSLPQNNLYPLCLPIQGFLKNSVFCGRENAFYFVKCAAQSSSSMWNCPSKKVLMENILWVLAAKTEQIFEQEHFYLELDQQLRAPWFMS